MHIRSAALTDIGKVRRQNEDRFVCDDALGLYGVADGIGGLPGGAEAAGLAIRQLHAAIAGLPRDSLSALTRITLSINDAVCELASRVSPLGMGTTLTYGIVRDESMHLAHVGDSRCYLLRQNKLHLLTMDHTVENDMRRRRAAGEFVLFDEAQRKSLTRCIGQRIGLEVDTSAHALQPGDRFLFCTDGIDKAVETSELGEILARDATPEKILETFIQTASSRGGMDNATGVLVFVD